MKNHHRLYINGAWATAVGPKSLDGLEDFLEYKSLQLRKPRAA